MSNTVVAMRDVVQMCLVGFSIQIERVAMAESGVNNVACSSSILKHCCSLCEASKQVAKTQKALPTNLHMPHLIECCVRGGVHKPRLFSWPCCFGIDSVSYSYASYILHCPSISKSMLD